VENLYQFAEKYLLALESSTKENPKGGLFGFELEWNLLDPEFKPFRKIQEGSTEKSFIDFMREQCIPPSLLEFSQREVFHWMVEWATEPFYTPRRAVYEARLLEGVLINANHKACKRIGKRVYYWHGNLLDLPSVSFHDIPDSWDLAKRRYLERCLELYGSFLATAGTHSNLSLPSTLFAWDFMHLEPGERGSKHLDDYKSEFYITASRLLRAFAALFIATGASTPLKATPGHPNSAVVITEYDSVRNLTFPNPIALDVPDLYRSYQDYLQLSYELVRNGIRFGNNNWTPIRARSFAEPVERLIAVTSEQLEGLYSRGLYAHGSFQPVDVMARQIEMQNLFARINLPMARVEVRTDDGGQPMDVDIANLTLKHLLMLRFYADPIFGRAFRYDAEDLTRARRNEENAARYGLSAEIENPFTGKPIRLLHFLQWTLSELKPLAEILGMWEDLAPLLAYSQGEATTAQKLRARLSREANSGQALPLETLLGLTLEREKMVLQDIETIAAQASDLSAEGGKLEKLLHLARQDARWDKPLPVQFNPRKKVTFTMDHSDKTSEIVGLAQALIRIPSVTASPNERLDKVFEAAHLVYDYLQESGLEIIFFDQEKYPAIFTHFPGNLQSRVMLAGHFDVVEPDPDDSQFEPIVDGDYLRGRGAADMKTVVATYLVWMKDQLKQGPPYPPINLLLVGNEENGESEPMGTPHVLRYLADHMNYEPELLIAGERTGERGSELWTEICIQNRGIMRLDVIVRGKRGHTGTASSGGDLADRIIAARTALADICHDYLTLTSQDGWQSQLRFPFIQVGTPGIYNISADYGRLGIEIRPIPGDDLNAMIEAFTSYCRQENLEIQIDVFEQGIACDPSNPLLKALIQAAREASGLEPVLGKKLPGTSARFSPHGQGVVWGQSGIGPHAKDERHFLPSILPYYQTLDRYAAILLNKKSHPLVGC
jgi:acetylornithine deacetylase/succinyl-diaminopimelate desuccinylase-like protein/gamma-glutamyl:cysteine ligase YbdK (ATP-grasp superfamily)